MDSSRQQQQNYRNIPNSPHPMLRAVKQSRLPIPVQITNLFVDAEEVD